MEEKKNLPTVIQIFEEHKEIAALHENLNYYLNQEPPKNWVKTHPFIPGHKYLPVDKVELLLRKIFKHHKISVKKTGMLLNAVEVTVRVWYWNPVTNKMEFHDGVGACEIQTNKDTGALKLDMSNISRGAVSMALPIAKTLAVKDACDHHGKLFGCDLNRKDTLNFNPDAGLMEAASAVDPLIQEALDLITDIDGLDKYVWQVTHSDPSLHKNWAFRNAIEATKNKLLPKN